MEILIVTGMSGAGKTAALKGLEDLGYYAIDNLPASLLTKIVDLSLAPGKKFDRVAIVMDVRGGRSFKDLFEALDQLRETEIAYSILFLDASDDVLVRRFSQTRRVHPLETGVKRVADAITEERSILMPLREMADVAIDTSNLNTPELSDKLKEIVPQTAAARDMKVTLVSFGYKFGLPLDADIIFDVRFLPNPYWVPELKDRTGQDRRVKEFVAGREETEQFVGKFVELIEFLIPRYARERKAYLTIGIGCTGGRHRSVVLADELSARLKKDGYAAEVIHRDIEKG